MKAYHGRVPPCGIFCGGCPNYVREKDRCSGAESHCHKRKCKGIYVCCVEKKGLEFCHQCPSFPCSRFKKFAQSWKKYGQDLLKNQQQLQTLGQDEFLCLWNKKE